MNNKKRKILNGVLIAFGLLAVVLSVHIYLVTRPKPDNPYKLVMARLDIKNNLSQKEANQIQAWLYNQEGVQNALVNPQSRIAIFTFYPAKVSGDQIVNRFATALPFSAKRYVPTKEEMESGCPAMSGSLSQRFNAYIKNTF